MSFLTPEISSVLTPSLIGLLLALTGCIGAWLKMKTNQWERMTEEARKFAKESADISHENHKMIEQNTEITKKIQLQGNGMRVKLQALAAAAAYKAGTIKGMLESTGQLSDKDIELMEKAFNESIKDHTPK